MNFGGFSVYHAFAVMLRLTAARTARKSIGAFFKSYATRSGFTNDLVGAHWFAAKPAILAQKNCPHCAEAMPISALFCDACDYNFLSGSLVTRQKSLPAPANIKRTASKPHLVSSRL